MSKDERIAEINKELKQLKEALPNATGRHEVEVYSRIVGYFRQTKNWNSGKKSEWAERKEYEV